MLLLMFIVLVIIAIFLERACVLLKKLHDTQRQAFEELKKLNEE